jgi:hypothetical protein
MVIIETWVFTRQVQELLSDEEYRELCCRLHWLIAPMLGQ